MYKAFKVLMNMNILSMMYRVLTSGDILSTDEESSGGESDDELGRDLETLLRGKKTTSQLTREQEEAERLELKRLIMEDKVSLLGSCRNINTVYSFVHYRALEGSTVGLTAREVGVVTEHTHTPTHTHTHTPTHKQALQ